ncbi:MAG TPA: hypothetical protein VHG51_11330 [Longimicrobiaceae bacterium]|nr:hypothetical protein [Longimicrobiaceae bacterium]
MKTIRSEELETLLEQTHAAFRRAGEAQGVWDRLVCTCGRPECEILDPTRHTLTLQMDALAAYWKPGEAAAEEGGALGAALTRLGDLLGFWEDAAPPGGDPARLLHAVRDRWLAGMGTPLMGPPDEAWLSDLHRVEARNSLLLEKLLERLAAAPFARLADAGAAHARLLGGRAATEGAAACRRTLLAWMDDHDLLPQRTLLREHLLAIVREAPWTAGEAQDVVRMAEDAAHAVLAFGIADDRWVTTAYGAMEQVAPFSALRVALVLEEDPVSPPLPGRAPAGR